MTQARAVIKAVVVAISSFFAIPLCEWLRYTSQMEDPFMIFLAGIFFAFTCVSAFCFVLLRFFPTDLQNLLDRVYYYVFCVFAFTAIVDLLIGMTLDGFVGSTEFYLHKGEPYLKSSYGSFINWWDGTFHWALYIYMTYLLTRYSGSLSDRLRLTGMVWVGSIMNSLVVFLPGNIAGKFGAELKWSYLLNVPYVLFPVLFVVRLFGQSTNASSNVNANGDVNGNANGSSNKQKQKQKQSEGKSLLRRHFDLLLFLGLLASVLLAFVRLFAAIRSPVAVGVWWRSAVEPYLLDPTLYPLLQTIIYAVYFVPYYIFAASSLASSTALISPSQNLLDWTCLHLGASLQAQFSFVGPSLHNIPTYPEPTWKPVPEEGWVYFVLTHSLLTLLPILLWVRVVLLSAPKSKSD